MTLSVAKASLNSKEKGMEFITHFETLLLMVAFGAASRDVLGKEKGKKLVMVLCGHAIAIAILGYVFFSISPS